MLSANFFEQDKVIRAEVVKLINKVVLCGKMW